MKLKSMINNRNLKLGIILLVTLIFFSIIGSLVTPFTYKQQVSGSENLAPSIYHIMGTDALGRDVASRIFIGIDISIGIALIAIIINLTMGLLLGVLAGYFGGFFDSLIMRIADIIASIPEILYLILIMVIFKNMNPDNNILITWIQNSHGIISIIITLSIAFWIPFARIIRGQVLTIKQLDFITAARVYGASNTRIIIKHILPNCIPIILVTAASRISVAIFFEAFLSFIGLGIEAPFPSLGLLLSDNLGSLKSAPYLLLWPAITILIIIFIMNLISDGIRDNFDSHFKR